MDECLLDGRNLAGYKLIGSKEGREAAIMAAEQLISRYQEKGEFIQAWGIYSLAMAYRYTRRELYIDLFKNVTAYFCDHLPEDLCPFWDLEFNDGADQPRDSSSASIAACGMLEMAKYMPKEDAVYYRGLASKLMKALYEHYAVKDVTKSNGLVLGSTYANHSPYNTCPSLGVNECNIWGDYYYMEALTRMSKDWEQYW